MIPSRLFRSRWSALLWAGGVLWTAYDIGMANRSATRPAATETPHDATGEPINAADLAVLAHATD